MRARAWLFLLSVLFFVPLRSNAAAVLEITGNEPARPLTAQGLDNLVAFTRLLGYVRHFHPSDQAAAADWNALAIAGVRTVEKAEGPAELARSLEAVFQPVAPTVLVFPTGAPPPPLPAALAKPGQPLKVVGWEHHGYVGFMPGIYKYKSERVVSPPRTDLADPGQPFRADLGAGVSALVPLALYEDEQGTLPHAAAPTQGPDKADAYSANDRATRLADVALGWNVPQHFYPYFDVVPVDWPAVLRTSLKAAATDADERAFLDTLCRMIAALQDGHGAVWHKSDPWTYRLPLLWDWIDDRLVVTRVAPQGTPQGAGQGTGLQRGDVVLKIDGRPAAEVVAARDELFSGATAAFRRVSNVFTLALGAQDTEVRLEVRHPSGETAALTLRRTVPSFAPGGLEEARPEKIAELRPGIFYLDGERVHDKDFLGAIDRLASAKGIVIDFRGHPSGLSPAVLAHLTDRPLVFGGADFIPVNTRPDRQGTRFEPVAGRTIQPRPPRLRANVAFLTNAMTLSYPESFLMLVELSHLAEIVGVPTAGTAGDLATFELPGGYQVLWTAMRVTKPDGRRFHGVGIQPTVRAVPTLRGVIEGRDEVLEKAVEVVSR
jgi:C-terminal processing protease CtpA/Prc